MRPAIRQAETKDIEAVAIILGQGIKVDMPFLPVLHTDEENLEYTKNIIFKDYDVWVAADENDKAVGFISFKENWIHHLYILKDHQGKGLGSALLNQAEKTNNELQLWAFQKNMTARAFYEAQGFKVAELTQGENNHEKEPDVRYIWKREIQ